MPKGHAPKRESKKPKRKAEKRTEVSPPVFTSPSVEVIEKRKKSKEEGF